MTAPAQGHESHPQSMTTATGKDAKLPPLKINVGSFAPVSKWPPPAAATGVTAGIC
jgi:hypothetical protein